MKLRFVSLTLAIAMMGLFTVGAAAAPTQKGGAAGVVAAVLQIVAANDLVDANNSTVQVGLVNLNNSLNNLRALNNVLNNSPILSNNDIDVTVFDVIDDITITVVDGDVLVNVTDNTILSNNQITVLQNFLNNNQDLIDAIVGIGVLNTGDLIVFQNQ